ncbi:phage recombination protein Bet [Bartonella sp. ML70XJBT.G]|uniref:phage recombination protein Bet n=1 Tax=Bartonella sp. ML70XJBT.G TaxID=3019093 RepID=UPI002360A45E|nr:phage recombination protein Bet [Bartonella sp. ML70XJBT.G]
MTDLPLAAMAKKYGFSNDVFKNTLKKTCIGDKNFEKISDEEFAIFLFIANKYGLNPLTKEIYMLPKTGGGMIPVVSIDGWIKIIKSNPNFDGMTFQDQFDKDGELIAIKCAIHLKGVTNPIEVTEYFSECKQDKSEAWKKYPVRMLRHKATIQCARYAFGFSGIYEEDEAKRINDTTPVQLVSYDILEQIKGLIKETGTNEDSLLAYAKVENLTDLSCEKAKEVLGMLERRKNFQRERALQSLPAQEHIDTSIQNAEYIHVQDLEYAPTQQTAV